ncbi:MAG: hypothetical protein HY868_05980 [Chloroflexi bacterium]|nr:hypothetical protein [Chloroflexota bacterium]
MSNREKMIFRIGRFLASVALGFWLLPLLWFAAWYVRNIPDKTKKLPFASWLQGNQSIFFDWLSGLLQTWFTRSVLYSGMFAVPFLVACFLDAQTIRALTFIYDNPVKIVLILYVGIVLCTGYFGFSSAKLWNWDVLIWRAEPAARLLAGADFDKYTEEQKEQLYRHIADVQAGINKGTWVVTEGKIELKNVPAGSFAKFGGPGVLIVQEGHVVITERSGRISQILPAGYHQLKPYERPQMVVYLPTRAERVPVADALTQDRMVITKLELLVFHRADRGEKNGTSGQYKYDSAIILEKIWSPKGGDWRDAVRSISESAARDIIAQYKFQDIVAISGVARRDFLSALVERINRITKSFLGVDVIAADLGAITISAEAKKTLEENGLVEVQSQTKVKQAEAEKKAKIEIGEGEREYLRREGEGKAMAAREEGLAKAEGESEKIRQFLLTLAQLPIDEERKAELVKTLLQGEQYRDAMRMWSSMGRSARGFSPQAPSDGRCENVTRSETT